MKGRIPPQAGGPGKMGKIEVVSGYGATTRVPYIELRLPERLPIQLEIDEARIVGQMILESCEAAEQDAFLVEWAMEQFDLSIGQAATVLHEYRAWREKRRNKQRTPSA